MDADTRDKILVMLEKYYPDIVLEDLEDAELKIMLNRTAYEHFEENVVAQLYLLNDALMTTSDEVMDIHREVSTSIIFKKDTDVINYITGLRRDIGITKDMLKRVRKKIFS